MEVAPDRIEGDWTRPRNRPWHNAGRRPRRETHLLLHRQVVPEGGAALLAGSRDGPAMVAPGLGGPGLGALRLARHPRFPSASHGHRPPPSVPPSPRR